MRQEVSSAFTEATDSVEQVQVDFAHCEVGRMAYLRLTEHLASKSKSRACTTLAKYQQAHKQ